jgi:hypothetical protein
MRLCHRIISTTGTPKSPTRVSAPRQPRSKVRAAVAGGATAKPVLPTKVWKAKDRPSLVRFTDPLRIE